MTNIIFTIIAKANKIIMDYCSNNYNTKKWLVTTNIVSYINSDNFLQSLCVKDMKTKFLTYVD